MNNSIDTTVAAFRNGISTEPDTHGARANKGAMLRAAQDAGYSVVGRACGHEKSWLSRFFSGECRISMPELLAMLDAMGLHVTQVDAEREDDTEILSLLLRKAATNLDRRAAAGVSADVVMSADEYQALLALAMRGIRAMQERYQ